LPEKYCYARLRGRGLPNPKLPVRMPMGVIEIVTVIAQKRYNIVMEL